jgi:glycosyltransferase involved in cell wall biosynthesis
MRFKKLLFVHDGPIYKCGDDYYGVHYDDKLIDRYLQLGESVTFLIRVSQISSDDVCRFMKISNPVFDVIEVSDFKSIKKYCRVWYAKKNIEKSIKECDALVIRLPSAIGVLSLRYAHKYKKPVLCEMVACVYDALWNYSWLGKAIAHYKLLSYKKIVRSLPYVIYVTSEFLQKRYPTKGEELSCSDVELSGTNISVLQERLTEIKNSNDSVAVTLGTVGALDVMYKRQGDVIKAISLLKTRGIIANYFLVGGGDKTQLEGLICRYDLFEQIKIIGSLSHKEVFRFYRKIDIYIQPSKVEGLPRAVIEAMSMACPVLGSKTGGIPELIDKSMLFKAGSVEEIAEKIISVNKSIMKEQAEKNYKKALQYEKSILDKKRAEFYGMFLSASINKQF